MAHIPTSNQGMLTGRAVETYYVGVHANGRHGGLLLYNPVTKHTIVRRSFRVMGSTSQGPPQRIYEATCENNDASNNNINPINEVVTTTEGTAALPILLDDSDDEEEQQLDEVAQYGNDVGLENDPVPKESDRKIQQHIPQQLAPHEIAPDHFIVEKILNHKGTAARPGTMELYVKWLGYEDIDNSWIKWKDNQDLAALDTYLANNPEIEVPVFRKKFKPLRKRLKQAKAARAKLNQPEKEEYIINYLPPKSIAMKHDFLYAGGTFRKVPEGVPRNFLDIPNVTNTTFWISATDKEISNMLNKDAWMDATHLNEADIPKHLILPSQLIYDIQKHPDGTIKQFKCRLVIR
jgi:hypothetical protein